MQKYTDLTPISSFRYTFWLLLAIMLVMFFYDIWAYFSVETGDTISEVTLWTAWRFPIVPFAVGVVCGHLFWPQWLPAAS